MIQEDEIWKFAHDVSVGDVINIAGEIFEIAETMDNGDGRIKMELLLIAMEIDHEVAPGLLASITVAKNVKLKIEE